MQTDLTPRLLRLQNFAADAAALILDEIRAALASRALCRVALSGGSTPGAVHAELVRQGADLRWDHVQFTFSDERCVPPEDPASNYRLARETLFDPLAIPAGNIFRVRGELDSATAAQEYENRLAAVATRLGEPRYVHDLLLLGMGPDGHTASLFPSHPALAEETRNIIPIHDSPKPPPRRVTMTFPLLNAARHACFLVTGQEKRPLVEAIVAARSTLPAAHVRAAKVTWLVD